MGSPTKTQGTSLLTWQTVATAAQAIGSAQDVATKLWASIYVDIGRASGTNFTSAPVVRVEASAASSGNDKWHPVFEGIVQLGSSVGKTTLNGAIIATATSCVVNSATNLAAGDLLFLGHTSDSTKYEIVRIKSVSGTTITFYEACTYAHDNSADVSDQAEKFVAPINLLGIGRLRVVVDNYAGGQSLFTQAHMVTTDTY